MADLTPTERLQPCLLDRLTDEDRSTSVESRDRRVVSIRQLRQAVLRDLAWLLNSSAHMSPADAELFPAAGESVLNFGLPDLTGLTASGLDPRQVERSIRDAIRRFEPRINPASVRVAAALKPGADTHNVLTFEIQGEMWAQPLPEPLYLRTEVDLETGECLVQERGGGRG